MSPVEFVDELATDSTGAELVFNEIGDFEGETSVTLDEFWGWVDVIADPESEWSIEID